jgi:hypothetical protein
MFSLELFGKCDPANNSPLLWEKFNTVKEPEAIAVVLPGSALSRPIVAQSGRSALSADDAREAARRREADAGGQEWPERGGRYF